MEAVNCRCNYRGEYFMVHHFGIASWELQVLGSGRGVGPAWSGTCGFRLKLLVVEAIQGGIFSSLPEF